MYVTLEHLRDGQRQGPAQRWLTYRRLTVPGSRRLSPNADGASRMRRRPGDASQRPPRRHRELAYAERDDGGEVFCMC